ncbi:MAG TPA: DUF2726 domain-containing protein [Candidatus Limnocylindria bacterium]
MGALAPASSKAIYPYRRTPSLVTDAELSFYKALCDVIGHRYAVMAKVRLIDLCAKVEKRENAAAFNQVVSKHVDFVLCDPENLRPVLIVELDDPSHFRSERRKRDAFLDEVSRTIGVRLLRQFVSRWYDTGYLARRLDAVLR